MSVIMQPSEVPFNWTSPVLKPEERLEIYGGLPYNGKEKGKDCATLTLTERERITVELDLTSAQHFDCKPGFWIKIAPGESYFISSNTPSETWTVPAGTSKVSFDCTIFVKEDISEPTSGTLIVRVKRASDGVVLGEFKINYLIEVAVERGVVQIHAKHY